MAENRKEIALRNSMISIVTQVCILMISFATRKVFVTYMDIELLGYESLFSNIFSLLNITELGLGSIITFHLYEEFAKDNHEEISKLMLVYKWFYRIVAITVLILGIIIYFFLPYLIKDEIKDWAYVHKIYLLQLAGVVSTYFLVTRRMLFKASQREYRCVQIDLYSKIIIMIGQLFSIAIFKDFILYLLVKIVGAMIANVWIAIATKKEYPYVTNKVKVTREDIDKRNIVDDVKNFMGHELAYAVYGGTDNIVISAFCSLRDVALKGNYLVVATQINNIFYYKLLDPVQATIGNFIYSNEDEKHALKLFKMIDLFGFFFAVYMASGFLVFYQPFMTVWLGEDYLLPLSFVFAFSLTTYLQSAFEIIYKFRCSYGEYRIDRNYMIVSAVLNIILSLIFVRWWGVTGVELGTAIAFLPTAFGRTKVVFKKFLKCSMNGYLIQQLKRGFLALAECVLLYMITKDIPYTVIGIGVRVLIWGCIPLLINALLFCRTPEYKMLKSYVTEMFQSIVMKRKSR